MTRPLPTSRRAFLAGAGALTLAIGAGGRIAVAADPAALAGTDFAPNAFIRIGADGQVTVISSYLEMGQGSFTGVATLAAEELVIGLDQLRVEAAPADVTRYANPGFVAFGLKAQGTGGSTAMAGAWTQMRQAAAAARMMLVAAAAAAWQVPAASLTIARGIITDPASGRTSGYCALAAAAAALPVPDPIELLPASAYRLIGHGTTRRVDIPAKVDGSAIYTQDVKLPGMLVAVVAYSPRLWGRPGHIDDRAARAIAGVTDVIPFTGNAVVRAGVAVLAANSWVARQGRDALVIDWDEKDALRLSSDTISHQFQALADQPGIVAMQRGTVLHAAPAGGHYLEARFDQPYLAHAAMEPMNCLVHLHDGVCEIWNGEQWHTGDQFAVAAELGLHPDQVIIHQLYAGGSFGRRANPRSDYVLSAVQIARAAKAAGHAVPIKLVWMREEDMQAAQYRPLTVHKVRLAVDHTGALVSWHQTVVGQSFMPTKPGAVDPMLVEGAADTPYAIPNLLVEQHKPADIAVPTQWLRSVGHTHAAVVGETMVDAAARLAARDPYAFRVAMLPEGSRERGVLDLAAHKAGWGSPLAAGPAGARRGRGIALQKSFNTYVAQVAEVTVLADGSFTVDRVVCAVDCGVAINPNVIAAQMEGGIGFGLSFLRQAIRFADGRVVQSNFNDYPVLRMHAMPPVSVHIMPSTAAPTGVGEPGVPPITPAVLNAIAAAAGTEIRSLPLGERLKFS